MPQDGYIPIDAPPRCTPPGWMRPKDGCPPLLRMDAPPLKTDGQQAVVASYYNACLFLYCFVVKGILILAKSLPPVVFEPATLTP